MLTANFANRPTITTYTSAANGQASTDAQVQTKAVEKSPTLRDPGQPAENDYGSRLRQDTNTRGGTFSAFLNVPGLRPSRRSRSGSLERWNVPDAGSHRSQTPETSARKRFVDKFTRSQERKSDDHPPSGNRPPSDESLDTARNRFIRRFRNDRASRKERGRRANHAPFTAANQLRNTIGNSWGNTLLLLIPVGMTLHHISAAPISIFVTNLIPIIPLAGLLSFALEEVALYVGETLGVILNGIFGYDLWPKYVG